MRTIAVIQARMGSTRLPGKVMLSLDCTPVIQHVVRRTLSADVVDEAVVATTQKDRDGMIARYASKEGAKLFRGDEEDVLGRVYRAAEEYGAGFVVRVTADNPLLSPDTIDSAVRKLERSQADYVSNKIDRTFPSGLDVEAFTFGSLRRVERLTDDPYHREHVTPYYREADEFTSLNMTADEVFNEPYMQGRTDLRLTLDRPDDYELFSSVYENVAYEDTVDVRDAASHIDENGLSELNAD